MQSAGLLSCWHEGDVMCDVGGMVLAAGLSERMDGSLPKQLLPLGARTVVAATVAAAEASHLDRIVVITGHRADEVAAEVAGGRAETVHNPHFESGNMSSFHTGATALGECAAVVVLLADMPGVTTTMINRLVDEWHQHKPWAAWSVYTDGPAHPLLFSAEALRKAANVEGPHGVWRFLESAAGDVLGIPFPMMAPVDINTRSDYERALGDQGLS